VTDDDVSSVTCDDMDGSKLKNAFVLLPLRGWHHFTIEVYVVDSTN
jgi:hypothetical protein